MKFKNSFVNSLIRDLNNTSRYLTEDYIFNDEGEEMPQDGRYFDDGATYQGQDENAAEGQQMPKNGNNNGDENAEEKAIHVQNVIQHEPIIQKIRETAIDGLKKYAEDPTSPIYEFFKKVFLESDKVLTDGVSNGK